MSATISLTEAQTFTALRSFLASILPAGIEIVRAEANRVPEPPGADFVVMTPILRRRLETNQTTYQDPYPTPGGARSDLEPVELTAQLDVHGPNGADNAQIIAALFRSDLATTAFAASGYNVQPLYAGEMRQTPFINGEQQYEYRWSVDVTMQMNPVVATGQQFAGTVRVGIVEVDAVYPP